MLFAVIAKIFFTILFILLTLTFCGAPVTGVCTLVVLGSIELWKMQISGNQWLIADIGLILFLVANLIRYTINREYDRKWLINLCVPIIAIVLSTLFSLNPMLSAAKGGQIILFAAGGYFIGAHLSGKRHSSLLLNCIAVSILLSMGFGVHKYITLEQSARFHLQGGFTDWNYYSIYLLCVSPIILYMTQKTKNAKQEIVFTSVLITLAILTILTGSRIGLLLFGCLLIQLIATGFIPFNRLKWLLPIAVVMALHLMQGGSGVFDSLFGWTSSARFQERIQHGILSFQLFAAHPFFGVGYGQMEAYIHWAYPNLAFNASSVDASLTTLLAETGLIGAFAFTGMFCYLFSALRTPENPSKEEKDFLRAAQISCLMLGLSGLFYNIHLHLFTWCWVGVLYGLFSDRRNDADTSKIQSVSFTPD